MFADHAYFRRLRRHFIVLGLRQACLTCRAPVLLSYPGSMRVRHTRQRTELCSGVLTVRFSVVLIVAKLENTD